MKVYHVKYTIALLWNFGISTALILWRQRKIRISGFKESYNMVTERMSK